MFKIVNLFFIFLAPAFIYAAIALQEYVPKPSELADREGCYVPSLNRVLPYNEPFYPKDETCTKYNCDKSNKTTIENCSVIAYDLKRCTITRDLSKDYPCCCGVINCGNDSTMDFGNADCH